MKPIRHLSLDTNTERTGVALWEGERLLGVQTLTAASFEEMTDRIDEAIAAFEPEMVSIEATFIWVNPATGILLSELVGAVRRIVHVKRIPFLRFTTARIDADAGLSPANGSRKAATMALARKLWNAPLTEHEADAVAVGFCAWGEWKREAWKQEA